MSASRFERLKYHARVAAGACLHATGLYRKLLPLYLPHAQGAARRLQAYLQHYYDQAPSAEGTLYLPSLGLQVACDIKDHMLWNHLEGRATVYEQADIDHCRQLARPGDHFLDVGANHGFWGFSLARHAGDGAVAYLCEPNPTILRRVQRTAALNPSVDARILPFAITDGSTEDITFFLPRDNLSGLGSTVLHATAKEHGYLDAARRMTVAARSIDRLVAAGAIGRIDMMKIDVEHAEDAVVRGADAALRKFTPRLVMMETSLGSAATQALLQMGYATPYRLDATGRPGPVEPGYWGNLFFVGARA